MQVHVRRHDALLQIPTSRPRCVMMRYNTIRCVSSSSTSRFVPSPLHRAPRPRSVVQANARPQQAVTLPFPHQVSFDQVSIEKIQEPGSSSNHSPSAALTRPTLMRAPSTPSARLSLLSILLFFRQGDCGKKVFVFQTEPHGSNAAAWVGRHASLPLPMLISSCSRLGLRWKDK